MGGKRSRNSAGRNMKHFDSEILFVGFAALVLALPAISQVTERSRVPTTNKLTSTKSTAELRKLLPLGMNTNQLAALFGKPEWIDAAGDNETVWSYFIPEFPADDDMRGTYVQGLTAHFTNGHLAHVGFMYRGGSTKTVHREEITSPSKSNGLPALKFFVVSDSRSPGARFVDTPQLPRLGYIGAIPNLSAQKLNELAIEEQVHTDSEGRMRTNWAFVISLIQEDGARLAALTSTNINNRLLITVGDRPTVAPKILEPVQNGRFQISCDENVRDLVKSNLAQMKR